MPNGGTPIHMVLKPKDSDVVIHCETDTIKIFTRKEWNENVKTLFPADDEKDDNGNPIATLSSTETAAIYGFIKHWLIENREPWELSREIDVDFAQIFKTI